jgi:glycine reductase
MHPENPGISVTPEVLIARPTATCRDADGAGRRGAPGHEVEPRRGAWTRAVEGYLPRGLRRVYDRQRPGYLRALDMLQAKLRGEAFVTEVPIHAPERVTPATPIADLSRATIALVTTGGLVRKGNPDKQVSSNATRYYRHTVAELRSLSGKDWEAYHSGYFNHIVNANPNYILPLNFLRDLEDAGSMAASHEDLRLAGCEHTGRDLQASRPKHRRGFTGRRGGRLSAWSHLRHLQSLRCNDRQGN